MGQLQPFFAFTKAKQRSIKLLMIGAQFTGKTSILNQWKYNTILHTLPNNGIDIVQINYNNIEFQITDFSGRLNFNSLFSHCMAIYEGLIIVIDSSNLQEKELLQSKLKTFFNQNQIQKIIPVLIIANKSDKKKYQEDEIIKYIGIDQYKDKIFYQIFETNCFSGEGLSEALEWLYEQHI
ncbi:ADP-ribosylation factor (macronuclear) [Tetrahymena thermophila SB210]|uniref:ADP-ribosylation factor n=1 Tax=Tetrahymena thermophila (strain SB210) TaxID=312017 RepID=A4VDI0_TETTS|nr:ADP-ribosylation factor [Tetrahymena thermophila SB210]EDK31585.1 ADP-ribosylation factor [Tetrahymena thermophila SB210]|eukprot:XP_001471412.1 ADP-ribosylation factor [Tetrahymena thermophila SB210]